MRCFRFTDHEAPYRASHRRSDPHRVSDFLPDPSRPPRRSPTRAGLRPSPRTRSTRAPAATRWPTAAAAARWARWSARRSCSTSSWTSSSCASRRRCSIRTGSSATRARRRTPRSRKRIPTTRIESPHETHPPPRPCRHPLLPAAFRRTGKPALLLSAKRRSQQVPPGATAPLNGPKPRSIKLRQLPAAALSSLLTG